MIWDKYDARVKNIAKGNFNPREFVETRIRDFVGTQDQINKERERLVFEAEEKEFEIRTAYYAEYNAIMEEYHNELFNGYSVPEQVLNKAYSIAYDRGHSFGYAEVENIFSELVGDFIEIYNLGLKNQLALLEAETKRLDWIAMHGSFGVDSVTGKLGGNGQRRIAATRQEIDKAMEAI